MNTNNYFRNIVESLPELVIVATPVTNPATNEPDFLIEYVNTAWESISGSRTDVVLGKLLSETVYAKSSIPWHEIGREMYSTDRSVRHQYYSELIERWLDITVIHIADNHICLNVSDITEIKQNELRLKQQNIRLSALSSELETSKNNLKLKLNKIETLNASLEQIAYYDRLTELPNRTKFKEDIADMLEQARHSNGRFALAIFDIDNLKTINDSLGYDIGDELIRQTAMRLKSFRKEGVIASRFGGDEFLLVITKYDHDAELLHIMNFVQESLHEPFLLLNTEVKSSVSIGVTTFPNDADNVHTLLKYADIALTDAKRRGKNTISFFHSIMQENLLRRISLEQKMFSALENEEFELYYQPQFDVETKQLRGFEALTRWNDRDLGYIGPDQFIPLAEETRLIIPLGEWIIRTACTTLQEWQSVLGFKGILSVNVSPVQICHSDFLDSLRKTLEDTGIPPRSLEIEITEGVFINDFQESIRILEEIRKLGVGISLDDFGTGYSSLSYLQFIPLNTLKIDKSFIENITKTQSIEYDITNAIVTLVNKLGFDTIAEGVETGEQLNVIRSINCKTIQGYLTGRPIPKKDCIQLIQTGAYTLS